MLRVIREIKPTWVVGENVFGLTNWDGGLVFEQVQADLEAEGYEVQPYVLPACAVNAPHRRDRVWFVSRLITNDSGTGCNGDKELEEGCNSKRSGIPQYESDSFCGIGASPNAERKGWERKNGVGMDKTEQFTKRIITDSKDTGLPAKYESSGNDKSRWKITGRQFKQSPCNVRGTLPTTAWDNFPTVAPLCSRNDGLSDRLSGITFSKWRNESIKAMGNSVVVPLVYQIFKAIEEYERTDP